ncbi:hypothetical protein [Aquimarina intermedia]|uniref:DUF4382 domain-containing protein n=1 Tax=Aquimarina intermedia TaxID=350814 RepID=A0A5S5CGE8_9FLAO|nr:hypothetical protein [Aquimarina intermedia]TYP77326.1 hypothetical protein BD809_101480 [Aquimarina intermedia]
MKKLAYLLMSFALVLSCSDDDSNQESTLNVTAGYAFTANKMVNSLKFTSGYIWLTEVEFEGHYASGDSIEVEVKRSSKIDLATGVATPSLDDIVIPTGDFVELELEVELRDEDAQPSIVMEGTYTRTDGSQAPIRFEYNSGETFEAEYEKPVTILDGETVLSRIVFDPNIWFSVVPNDALDNATVNADGVIVISGTSNQGIFDLVADRLDESTESEFE